MMKFLTPVLTKFARNHTMRKFFLIPTSFFLLISVIWIAFPATAQTPEPVWEKPINISNSGASKDPTFTLSINGQLYIFWRDDISGVKYISTDLVDWSEPKSLLQDFGNATPKIISDNTGILHAFWIDALGFLQTINFSIQGSNELIPVNSPQIIAQSAIGFSVGYDDLGQIHLVYIRPLETQEFPAGVYYRSSRNNGVSWETSTLVQPSPYFRSTLPENTNIQFAISDENIYIAWDNRPRRRIFFTRSIDSGLTWETPFEIDGPQTNAGGKNPYGVHLAALEDTVMLFWQRSPLGAACQQMVQISSNRGQSWDDPVTLFNEFSLCTESAGFIPISPDLIILYATFNAHVYFVPWNGAQWSTPLIQRELSELVNPDTLETLILACDQYYYYKTLDKLIVAGCSTGDFQDIWLTYRDRGFFSGWFPPPSAWQNPELLADFNLPVSDIELVIDRQDGVHAIWNQVETESPLNDIMRVGYSRLNATDWTTPITILAFDQRDERYPSITSDYSGRLIAAWENGVTKELYFSWANAAQADIAVEWNQPINLPILNLGATAPQILASPEGVYSVIYALPLNEGRGLYITESQDRGETWSVPTQIFDAASAGWQMVGNPVLTTTQGGQIHIIIPRLSFPGTVAETQLYYMYSADKNRTWSAPVEFISQQITWEDIVSLHAEQLMRLWVTIEDNTAAINYQTTQDGGTTWSLLGGQSISGELIGNPALITDPAGDIHLFHISHSATGNYLLHHWRWVSDAWIGEEDFNLSQYITERPVSLAAGFSSQGRIHIIINSYAGESPEDIQPYKLFYTQRDFSVSPSVVPMITLSSVGAAKVTPASPTTTPIGARSTEVSSPTATPTALNVELSPDLNTRPPNSNQWTGALFGGAAGIIIVIGFLATRYLRSRMKANRDLGEKHTKSL